MTSGRAVHVVCVFVRRRMHFRGFEGEIDEEKRWRKKLKGKLTSLRVFSQYQRWNLRPKGKMSSFFFTVCSIKSSQGWWKSLLWELLMEHQLDYTQTLSEWHLSSIRSTLALRSVERGNWLINYLEWWYRKKERKPVSICTLENFIFNRM